MEFILGVLTVLLVLNCLFLGLLILIQLPKKEAGLGTAFGSSATDALFGAGTGNVLTKLTKYATVTFFVITLSMTILNAQKTSAKKSTLQSILQKSEPEPVQAVAPTSATNIQIKSLLQTNAPVIPSAINTNIGTNKQIPGTGSITNK